MGRKQRCLGVLMVGAWLAGANGCFMLRCEDDFHGVHEGDRFSTTIVGSYAEKDALESTHCDGLGDLEPGTTFEWTARPDGPGDGCDDELDVEVTALPHGTVKGSKLSLDNGCTGTWIVTAHPVSNDTDFLSNDAEHPSWYLRRHFETASGACGVTSCTDYFIATSKR